MWVKVFVLSHTTLTSAHFEVSGKTDSSIVYILSWPSGSTWETSSFSVAVVLTTGTVSGTSGDWH